jgi:G protein-coupled glucose receptor regulating Gpa2
MNSADLLAVAATTSTFSNGTVVPVNLSSLVLYTEYQKRVLRILALTFSSLSILAGTLMFYWYITLRKRTFRHTYAI